METSAEHGQTPADRTVEKLGFHSKVFLCATLRCPIRCRHCAIDAEPNRREEMPKALLDILLADCVRSVKVRAVVFSGGEPFLVSEKIREAVRVLQPHGIAVCVQTSAYWAKSRKDAVEALKSLGGIRELIVSADEFHQEFVPIRNVANACMACAELGVEVKIHTLAYECDAVEITIKEMLPVSVASTVRVVQNEAIHLVGRGCDLREHPRVQWQEGLPDRACASCSVAFVLPDGTVTACGGDMQWSDLKDKAFTLGSVRAKSFGEITSAAEANYLVHAMRLWGPKRFAEVAAARGVGANLRSAYIRGDVCDLCCELFSKAEIVRVIREELENPEFRREVALARALCFGEVAML